ncbi:MAG: restriction endonuclease [Bacteroidales bacterium]|nr:restriction endonuclease [Bacteroidales bacterium]
MVPTFDLYIQPFLDCLKGGEEKNLKTLSGELASYFKLTEEDLADTVAKGTQSRHYNRVNWAGTYTLKAGLTRRVKPGCYQITDFGKKFIAKWKNINPALLREQIPAFAEFAKIRPKGSSIKSKAPLAIEEKTPTDMMNEAFASINDDLVEDLLSKLHNIDPQRFEQIVIDLLVKMGYGGNFEDAAQVTKYRKDDGIDGVIKEDKLGLDKIYVQAKRWTGTVGKPEIHTFIGALSEQGANKGVFITTSKFSAEARAFKPKSDVKVILIDGEELCHYMIEYGVGVSVKQVYEVKRIDSDYFEE